MERVATILAISSLVTLGSVGLSPDVALGQASMSVPLNRPIGGLSSPIGGLSSTPSLPPAVQLPAGVYPSSAPRSVPLPSGLGFPSNYWFIESPDVVHIAN